MEYQFKQKSYRTTERHDKLNEGGKVKCTKCKNLKFGYYCDAKKNTPPYKEKNRVCGKYIKL